MKRFLFAIALWLNSFSSLTALTVLPSEYLVVYGSNEAPVQVVEFMSLSCPHCIDLYVEEFDAIRKQLIDTGTVQWIFHPYPVDEVTVTAFSCMPKLGMKGRKFLLNMLLKEAKTSDPEALLRMIRAYARKIGKISPNSKSDESWNGPDKEAFNAYLSNTEVDGTPLIAINGVLRVDLTPSLENILNEINNFVY